MRKYLIQNEGRFYKANLHAHSTMSDGHLSPEQLKEAYKSHGYAILAITDHETMFDHSDLNDEDFLTLTGYEQSINESGDYFPNVRACHLNIFSDQPHKVDQVLFDPNMLIFQNAQYLDQIKYVGPTVKREYSITHINDIIAAANAQGYLVSLNHPTWNLETFDVYSQYQGLFAMEIYNTCAAECGSVNEHDENVYDALLRSGKHLYCVATDDCHSEFPIDQWKNDSFGGWVMIKAQKLDYTSIFTALKNGQFYASCGPCIQALYVEDGELVIECDPVKSIRFSAGGRKVTRFRNEDGSLLSSARVPIADVDIYKRVEIMDANGNKAYTNAYFMEELK